MNRVVAVSVTGLLALMVAGPAQAAETTRPSPSPSPSSSSTTPAPTCDSSPRWTYKWDGKATLSVSLDVKDQSSGLCKAVTFQASSYAVPHTWNRKGFNATAVPQTLIQHKPITIPAGAKDSRASSTLDVGQSGPYQVDLYTGPPQNSVGTSGTAGFLTGGLVDRTTATATQVAITGITVAQVEPTAPTCTADGSLPLTTDSTYTWGEVVKYGVGKHHVTATATDGFTFADDQPTISFDVTVLPATGNQSAHPDAACYVEPASDVAVTSKEPVTASGDLAEPIVTDPITAASVVAAPVVAAPVVAAPVVAAVATDPAVLASTGINGLPWMLGGAGLLIVIGVLTMAYARRVRR